MTTEVVQVAFFTSREVRAGEELTWDYGCTFNTTNNIMMPFACSCGSRHCRAERQKT